MAPWYRSALDSLVPAMLGAIVLATLGLTGACERGEAAAELEIYGELPALAFTDQTGAAVTDDDLRGQPVIANFVFTRCPTVCPVFSMKMQRIAEQTADLGERLQLVSFSVDPEHDTPPVLAAFAARYDADPARWRFLTGDPAAVKDTVEGALKISMERRGTLAGDVPDIVHGTHFVLLDPQLRIRGYYDSSDADRLRALVEDARALAAHGD